MIHLRLLRLNDRRIGSLFKKLNVGSSTSSSRPVASMSAWKVDNSLNDSAEVNITDKLRLTDVRIPTIGAPSDILVKIHSTSVNPLDIRMCYGYGRRVLDILHIFTDFEPKITNDRYPLTLGRDFSGEIVAVGPSVKEYKPGDLVMGAVDPQRAGAHAQFVSVPSYSLTHKPENLSHTEAASIPFVALTAYSALCTFGGLSEKKSRNKNILVLGGSGGVGSFAIQLLKLWEARITATCSDEKIDWLENTLFVDQAVNYEDTATLLSLKGKFDFVLDCGDYERISKSHRDIVHDGVSFLRQNSASVYVNLSPPILRNTDDYGIVFGAASTAVEAVADTITGLKGLNSARWAVFLPNKSALKYIAELFKDGSIAPMMHSTFSFDKLPEAYEELKSGVAKGKVVVDVTKSQTTSDGEKAN